MGVKRRKLIVGNWKMNCLRDDAINLVNNIIDGAKDIVKDNKCDLLVCPPYTLLHVVNDIIKDSKIMLGAQDSDIVNFGAHTGDICAEMLKDAGCSHVIVGHSERRTDHGECSEFICEKAKIVHSAGMKAIICIGESEKERADGMTMAVISTQIDGSVPDSADAENTIIAYEPIWAIGTGKVATADDAEDVHDHIRSYIASKLGHQTATEMIIIYGGSMKPENAGELLSQDNIDGGLIGGAALDGNNFIAIAKSAK